VTKRSAALCLLAFTGVCLGQEAQNDIFDKMLEHYRALDGCTVTLGFEMRSDQPGMADLLASMKQTNPGYAVKPNQFAFWSQKKSDAPSPMAVPLPSLYSDGEQLLAAVESMAIYSVEDAPESFGAMLSAGEEDPDAAWKMLPGAQYVFALMSSEPRESLDTFLGDVEYKGVEGEAAEACHVVATSQKEAGGEETKLELRIKAEGEPWLVSVKPDLSGSGAPAGFEVLMTFSDWAPASEAPDQGQLTPQESWQKVDDLAEAVVAKMRGPAQEEDQAASDAGPMANTPAPAFTLPLLGGGEFSPAQHQGKVVVLDFWATWCGPCIRGLPTVTKVTSEYAPKGVAFAAVNLQEQAEKVSEFMANKGWDFAVALDGDGSVADKFGVSAIPHSVIIDKKGVIRHVHVGFDPATYEEELRKELDALLAE